MTWKEKRALRKRKKAAKRAAKEAEKLLEVKKEDLKASLYEAFTCTLSKALQDDVPDDEDGDPGDG